MRASRQRHQRRVCEYACPNVQFPTGALVCIVVWVTDFITAWPWDRQDFPAESGSPLDNTARFRFSVEQAATILTLIKQIAEQPAARFLSQSLFLSKDEVF